MVMVTNADHETPEHLGTRESAVGSSLVFRVLY